MLAFLSHEYHCSRFHCQKGYCRSCFSSFGEYCFCTIIAFLIFHSFDTPPNVLLNSSFAFSFSHCYRFDAAFSFSELVFHWQDIPLYQVSRFSMLLSRRHVMPFPLSCFLNRFLHTFPHWFHFSAFSWLLIIRKYRHRIVSGCFRCHWVTIIDDSHRFSSLSVVIFEQFSSSISFSCRGSAFWSTLALCSFSDDTYRISCFHHFRYAFFVSSALPLQSFRLYLSPPIYCFFHNFAFIAIITLNSHITPMAASDGLLFISFHTETDFHGHFSRRRFQPGFQNIIAFIFSAWCFSFFREQRDTTFFSSFLF